MDLNLPKSPEIEQQSPVSDRRAEVVVAAPADSDFEALFARESHGLTHVLHRRHRDNCIRRARRLARIPNQRIACGEEIHRVAGDERPFNRSLERTKIGQFSRHARTSLYSAYG